jgi:hypothetical protein
MAQPPQPRIQRPLPTREQLEEKLNASNFDPNAILRGAQLTVVGGQHECLTTFLSFLLYFSLSLSLFLADDDKALRALQNPALFTSKHYKQAAIAVGVGIAIRLAIAIPVLPHPP